VIAGVALRDLAHRPARSALLFGAFGVGVAVMIVLLAIGQALLVQASDERLIGGGTVTVLPEGVDVEVMKTGGVGGLFFSIANARFIYAQLLASPRLARNVTAAAPQIDGKLLYLRTRRGEIAVRASGEIPSRNAAVGVALPLAAGEWNDDEGDRRWIAPTPRELYDGIDHFHRPPDEVLHPESWAEWHYFNVLSEDGRRWAFISFMVAGDVRGAKWEGRVAVTLRELGGATRRFTSTEPPREVRFSTTTADLDIGDSRVRVLDDGRYDVRATIPPAQGETGLALHLVVAPAPRAFFPGATLTTGPFTSGYAVAALRASATGEICAGTSCHRFVDAQAYHDHNWGVWRAVSWDWGSARAGPYTLLYGRVEPPVGVAPSAPVIVYLIDSLGFRSLFRPRGIAYDDGRVLTVGTIALAAPSRAELIDERDSDTLRVDLTIEDAIATDTRRIVDRGDVSATESPPQPFFVQMKGHARLSGRLGGVPLTGDGEGFFETFR